MKTVKEKVLLLLEHDRDEAEREVMRWADAVHRYDADLLFNEEQGFAANPRTLESRAAAKSAQDKARETKRLYNVAINAVRRA